MDDVPFRRSAGRRNEREGIRVDLTRHCLAHGRLRLPYALRDRVPEGVLSARDAVADVDLPLEASGGELFGLQPLFERHALQPNDAILVRIDDAGAVHVAPVPAARAAAGGDDRPLDAADPAPEARLQGAPEVPAAPTEVAAPVTVGDTVIRAVRRGGDGATRAPAPRDAPSRAPLEARLDEASAAPAAAGPTRARSDAAPADAGRVVDRFGSVTVRRLGKHHVPTPEPATMPQEAAPHPSAPPAPTPSDADGFDATLVVRDAPPTPTARDDAMLTGPAPTEAPNAATSDAAAPDGGDAPAPVQPGLFAGGPARPDAPRPRAPRSPRPPTRAVRDPGRSAPPPVTVDDLADPRDVGWNAGPQASAGGTAAVGTTASASSVAAPASPADAADVDADVRARVDRWLRDPRTPVLVRLDRLRDACELDDATTRRVVDALLATPPDGLVLEAIAPGYVRVARERPRRSGA